LIADLEAALSGATEAKQFGAVNGSVALMGKLTGLLTDRVEIGAPGNFSQCETTEQVVDKLLSEQSPADALLLLDEFRP
jgi:hypothetical protein